jgi:HAD superfamily hydrolase (TIGR01459 family)
MSVIISAFSEIADRYDAAFVDLWGCMHNGLAALPEAVTAMQEYRAKGGIVVLVTNSPRPRFSVADQIAAMGVPADAWDTIATSGDSARAAMFQGAVGQKVWFMGETPRDDDFFKPLKLLDNPVTITQVPLAQADGIVCCGPFDPHADPAVNRGDFLYAKTKGLKLLCANPDIVVDRGDDREWCAGALAALYTDMGGESLYFGKPHPPIYDLARRRLAKLEKSKSDPRIICIGDGISTDIQGAMGEDYDSLFIAGGLAAGQTMRDGQPQSELLRDYFQKEMMEPTYAIGQLR